MRMITSLLLSLGRRKARSLLVTAIVGDTILDELHS
jgi:hypothetical protein